MFLSMHSQWDNYWFLEAKNLTLLMYKGQKYTKSINRYSICAVLEFQGGRQLGKKVSKKAL